MNAILKARKPCKQTCWLTRRTLLEVAETLALLVVPHKPEESTLVQALEYEHWQMPPAGKLPETTIENFRKWIRDGAYDPRPESSPPTRTGDVDRLQLGKAHWAYQPIQRPAIPSFDSDWPLTPIDAFIYQRSNETKLGLNADTDKASLLRRLYLNLIGLPPTAEVVLSFINDDSPIV